MLGSKGNDDWYCVVLFLHLDVRHKSCFNEKPNHFMYTVFMLAFEIFHFSPEGPGCEGRSESAYIWHFFSQDVDTNF